MTELNIKLSHRDRRIAYLSLSIGLTLGMWLGLWLVPDAALSVPMDTEIVRGSTVYDAAYKPVPAIFPFLSLFVVGVGIWLARDDPLDDRDRLDDQEAPADD